MRWLERGARLAPWMLACCVFATPAQAQVDAAAQHTETAAHGPSGEEQTLFNVGIGVTGNSGNTRAVSGNGGFTLLLRRQRHEFSLDGLGTLGWATPAGGTGDLDQNAANFVGRARYDYFITERDSVFAAVVPRRDIFAGINARIQVQAGYMRTFFNPEENHRFWGELGGDVTVDRYRPIEQDDGSFSDPDPREQEIYSVRLFAGYTNRLNSAAEINLGVEALLPPYNEEGEDGNYRYRINGNAELNSSLSSRFKLGVAVRMLYDSSPPEGTRSRLDTISTLQLVYTYDSVAEAAAEAVEEETCPPCEATQPEVEAAAAADGAPDEGVPPPAAATAPVVEAPAGAAEPIAAPPTAEVPPASPESTEAPTADAPVAPPAQGGE